MEWNTTAEWANTSAGVAPTPLYLKTPLVICVLTSVSALLCGVVLAVSVLPGRIAASYSCTFGNLALWDAALSLLLVWNHFRHRHRLSAAACLVEALVDYFLVYSVQLSGVFTTCQRYHIICQTRSSTFWRDKRRVTVCIAGCHSALLALVVLNFAWPTKTASSLHADCPQRGNNHYILGGIVCGCLAAPFSTVFFLWKILKKLKDHVNGVDQAVTTQSAVDSKRILWTLTIQGAAPVVLAIPMVVLLVETLNRGGLGGVMSEQMAALFGDAVSVMGVAPLINAVTTVVWVKGYSQAIQALFLCK